MVPRFIGRDPGERAVEVGVLDENGRGPARHGVAGGRAARTGFAGAPLKPADRLAVEATTDPRAAAEVLNPFVAAVGVGDPLPIKATAPAEVKADEIDAGVPANPSAGRLLARRGGPDVPAQKLRHRTGVRSSLVADRTRRRNRVRSIRAGPLVQPPDGGLFAAKRPALVRRAELPPGARGTVNRFLTLVAAGGGDSEKTVARRGGRGCDNGMAESVRGGGLVW